MIEKTWYGLIKALAVAGFLAVPAGADSLTVTRDSIVYEGGTYDKIDVFGRKYVTFRNVTLKNLAGNYDYAGMNLQGALNIDVDSCRIDGNAKTCNGIYMTGASRVNIRDCEIFNCEDDGINMISASFVNLWGNKVHTLLGCGTDNSCSPCNNGHSDGMRMMGGFKIDIRRNIFYDILSTSAIMVSPDMIGAIAHMITVMDNLVYVPTVGLVVYFEATDSLTVMNNVFWGVQQGGYGGVSLGTLLTKFKFYNNIALNVNLTHMGATYDSTKMKTDYNVYGVNTGQSQGWPINAHDIIAADPGFNGLPAVGSPMKTGARVANDFALKSTSPAINKGTTVYSAPAVDFYGNTRNGAIDIGGIEYQGAPGPGRIWFKALNREGAGPLNVAFNNASPTAYTTWLWNFGDGATSTEKSPAHTYNNKGRYSVTLQGSGTGISDSLTVRFYVVVTSGAGILGPARQHSFQPAVTVMPNPVCNTAVFHVAGAEPQYISIFDHAGQPVQSLVNCNTWDGRDQNGRPQAPGIYLYQVSGHGFTVSGKLVKAR